MLVLRNMTYTSKRVSDAARLLNSGLKEVSVGTQAQAEELFLTQFLSKGYKNTTGLITLDMKDKFLFSTSPGLPIKNEL